MQYHRTFGRVASPALGDLQGFSNIEADGVGRVGELWIEHATADGRLRVKVGNVDANTEFAHTDHGALFLNSSMGVSPSILALPTFPDPATSASVFVRALPALTIGAGIFDGDEGATSAHAGLARLVNRPASHFAIGEATLHWSRGRVAAGGWRHSGSFDRLDAADSRRGATGHYLTLDHSLVGAGDDERLGAYVQWARTDRRVAGLSEHLGAGLVLATRARATGRDALGLAASVVRGGAAGADDARQGEWGCSRRRTTRGRSRGCPCVPTSRSSARSAHRVTAR